MSAPPEWLEGVEEAHRLAEKFPYVLVRVSDRRWGIVAIQGGSSVTSVDGKYIGYRHATFVEGCERLPFEQARQAIARLFQKSEMTDPGGRVIP